LKHWICPYELKFVSSLIHQNPAIRKQAKLYLAQGRIIYMLNLPDKNWLPVPAIKIAKPN
jgi:hypothetical protein